MTESSDDDDLPDLESVDSSEYYSEDDDSDLGSDLEEAESGKKKRGSGIDKSSSFYAVAKKWLELDHSDIEKQLLVISVHLFSPFLFGHAHQSDRWLKWCHEVGLLVSDYDFNKDCLTAIELTAVDVLDKAMEHCRNCMMDRECPDSLFMLLKLANEIKQFESVAEAVDKARHREWFKCMLDVYTSDQSIGPISNRQLGKSNFLEIGCLYAINQTAEHVHKFLDGQDLSIEFDESVAQHTKDGEVMKRQGDELFMAGKSEEAIDVYTTAIYCCPYYYDLYLKRAYVFLELQKFQDAQSDSVRAVHLRPSHQEGYIRYIQCLSACDDRRRLPVAQRKYSAIFPGVKHKEHLRLALDSSPAFQRRKIDASEEDRSRYEKLTGLCKQASEAYLHGNVDNALLYFDESVRTSSEEKGWQHCMVLSESQRFIIALHFAYGLALLKKGSSESTSSAMDQFSTILKDFESIAFPPAFYGLGKALVQLHRHSEALEKAKEGLSLLPNYHLPVSLTWPGTNEILQETLSQNVEMLLQQLQQQCEPVCLPDAVCRYGNCLQYYPATDIHLKSAEYKGHVTLHCTDSCSISYHASCWRRYKTDGVTGADKDYLQSDCPTPDCPGTIDTVSVYDNRAKLKIKYESEAQIKKAPPIVPSASSSSLKESRRSGRSKQTRKKKPIGSISDAPPTDVAKETETKPDVPDKPEREESVEDPEVLSQEEVGVTAAVGVAEVSEDSRKSEDSLAVINRRRAEAGEEKEKEVGGAKSKPKKKKSKSATSAVTQQWSELFTLPDRHCESAETAAVMEETTKKSSWQQDPAHPFLPPDHLRDAVDHFEKTEVPRLGLRPAPVPASPADEGAMKSSQDFVFSYFAEILKNCGPLKANDPRLTDALLLLPDEKRHSISLAGGLERYLLTSLLFNSYDDLICLAEDTPVIRDSISQSSSSSSSGSSLGAESMGERAGRGRSGSDVANQTSKSSGRSRQTASGLSSEKQSLNSLADSHQDGLSGGAGGGGNSLRFEHDPKLSTKTYGVELGSGVNSPSNSPADSPRLMSPTDHVNIPSGGGGVGGGNSGSSVGSQSGGSSRGGIGGGNSASSVDSLNGISGSGVVGGGKSQKLGTTAPGAAKRPNSAGETRESTDVTLKAGKNVASTKAIGHERKQRMKEKVELSSNASSRGGRNGGRNGRTEKPPERLLSTASSDGGIGILGEFFDQATREADHLSLSSGGRNSRGGSQGEADTPSSLPSSSALANSKLLRAAMSTSDGRSTPPSGSGGVNGGTRGSSRTSRDVGIQTGPMWTGVKFVQTDPLPVVDHFKERYDKVLKEKKDLQVKLERSEDQKFKMQRDHRREVEKLEKKYYDEAKKESEEKIRLLEERVVEERQKGQASKKDQADLIRSHKAEIKSLQEKVEKLKKEVSKKDLQIDTNMVQYHSEIEHLRGEKRRYDDRIRSEVENSQKALRRAVDAEIEVLSMRREAVARPCEQRLKEVETLCGNIPPGTDFHRDMAAFRDKLKTSFDCFQNAMDDQIHQVKSGRELANLDRVPNPNLVVPPHLRVPMPMMRPRFMPMMPVRGGPLSAVPGGLVMDPGAFGGPRMPMAMHVGGPLVPSGDAGGNPPVSSEATGGDLAPQNEAENPSQPPSSKHSGDVEKEQGKGGGGVGGATGGGGGGRKKSSFERIVEKLAPLYPSYSREDFKGFLHEVRRNNNNTLSGLSLDSITDQVRTIIDSYEKGRGSSSSHGGGGKGASGSGNGRAGAGKGRQNKSKSTSSRQQQAPSSRGRSRQQPQVAVAEPPVMSSIDYDDEGSCIICYEDMIDFDSSRLNCGHRFHTDCIRSWFKEQSTCPTCRNHSLLPEEYPFLK